MPRRAGVGLCPAGQASDYAPQGSPELCPAGPALNMPRRATLDDAPQGSLAVRVTQR
ncbi:hypothetical protein Pla100_29310 [Neorhodopirellula pilleata]|uniref:Uncharacterized protein n=1 Tax=Neorhodopirellula pilleata TaxID=2714738 RepID=A0A5C6ABL2_9BACT|nr:hypothetical protein Pla100_29310 [Neorhodopirellula pilleata]